MDLTAFITKWKSSGGNERANKDSFLRDLCDILDVPHPDPKTGDPTKDAYVFERDAPFTHKERRSIGKIDLYRRGCFVLEAKQGSDAGQAKRGTAKRGTDNWVNEMEWARTQARNYVDALPNDEPLPVFLIVCDLGECFDLYAQFDRSGRYHPFPDPTNKRIKLSDLPSRRDLIDRLRRVWLDPQSLDPAKQSAKVSREIAEDLAKLANSLEKAGHPPDLVATFLMRCIFTMFAEDVGLLPERLFAKAIEEHWIPNPAGFPIQIEMLWRAMNGGESFGFVGKLLRFNGGLFANPTALPLTRENLVELLKAAKRDWSQVEPAIFGTLLERALSEKERHKLGAHYTPRAYVERLIRPTVEEPLRAEWDVVRAQVHQLLEAGKSKEARAAVHAFHQKLTSTRILDPACGSGNFLYVTLDLFKRLEAEVLGLLRDLGETQQLLDTALVNPSQFLGIEVKRWAKEIAELVLWIGYLQWYYRTHGRLRLPPEPVLQNYGNIECRDAVLAWDREELVRDDKGKPVTRWDGETTKKSSVTGEDVPDETARVPIYQYVNARKAEWPKADFIVGNPPFLGNWRMRDALGSGYVEALRAIYTDVPESCDYVMYWWNQAAHLARSGNVQRFGLITTNSITQVFAGRLLQSHLDGDPGLSLVFAIPDHPWVDTEKGAAVRIAMTVGARGRLDGELAQVTREVASNQEQIDVELKVTRGLIHSNLRIGPNLTRLASLRANSGISSPGVKLHGAGFIVTKEQARALGLGVVAALDRHIRHYRNGRDMTDRPRGVLVIDMFGLSEMEVRERFPKVFQWLLERVKPERDAKSHSKDGAGYARLWWLHGKPRSELRRALAGLQRFIATVETAKHRVFVFLEAAVLPDNMLVNIAIDDAYHLGALSSRIHVVWALATGGRLGIGNDPRYNKTRCFDPFPFPAATEPQKQRIRVLGEQLDAHRKKQQAQHPDLTITGMYNVLEKLRAGTELTAKEKVIHEQGLVSILKQIHDDLDAAVFDAYGWPHDLTEEQILEKLVALNAERAEEERNGLVRWLRPEFQNPGGKSTTTQVAIEAVVDAPASGEDDEAETSAAQPKAAPWPKKLPGRIAAVRDLITGSRGAWGLAQVVGAFTGAKKNDVAAVLESLSALGILIAFESNGETRYQAAGRSAA